MGCSLRSKKNIGKLTPMILVPYISVAVKSELFRPGWTTLWWRSARFVTFCYPLGRVFNSQNKVTKWGYRCIHLFIGYNMYIYIYMYHIKWYSYPSKFRRTGATKIIYTKREPVELLYLPIVCKDLPMMQEPPHDTTWPIFHRLFGGQWLDFLKENMQMERVGTNHIPYILNGDLACFHEVKIIPKKT